MHYLSLTTSSPCKVQGTLKLTRDPLNYGAGNYTDVDGSTWNIECLAKREE